MKRLSLVLSVATALVVAAGAVTVLIFAPKAHAPHAPKHEEPAEAVSG